MCCISYHFYIKPQPLYYLYYSASSCISYHFYIKPQLKLSNSLRSIVVYLIISTSNHNIFCIFHFPDFVVYLIISTSNHNFQSDCYSCSSVVYLIISTSNHNSTFCFSPALVLYILSFLHQTTTLHKDFRHTPKLYILSFLHQTTTLASSAFS